MGDSIDNIPGVPGVGEKTAVKLIGQFGSVERLYENLHLVPGKLRETLATHRAQALLSRELATVSTRVPLDRGPREPSAAGAGLGQAARALDEIEFASLLRQLPAAPVAAVAAEAAPVLADAEALAATRENSRGRRDRRGLGWRGRPARSDAGCARALSSGGGRPPPSSTWGERRERRAARLRRTAADRARRKAPGQWWLARGGMLPAVEDTAVAAYLLNPAKTNYRLEEVAGELLGEGPGLAPPGSRARWIWELWAMAAARAPGGRAPRALRGHRAAVDPRARRHGAARHPRRPGRLDEFSRSSSWRLERLDPRDLRARRRRVQHRLAQAARHDPVRGAQAAAGAEDQDRLLDRRRRAGAARARPRAAREDHRAPDARQAQVDLRRLAARR